MTITENAGKITHGRYITARLEIFNKKVLKRLLCAKIMVALIGLVYYIAPVF